MVKVPYGPNTRRPGSSTAPDTWADFAAAVAAYAGGGYEGVGYVFSLDDPFAGIDLDNCIDASGAMADWAKRIVDRFNTYTEISPSGTGVKLFLCGTKPEFALCEKRGFGPDGRGKVEVYDQRRYFTLTGRVLSSSPSDVAERQEELETLCRELWPPPAPARGNLTEFVRPDQSPGPPAAVSDQERYDRCLAAMARLSMEDRSDGSKRLFVAACRCVEHDLSDEQAVACIRAYAERKPFLTAWSDADILKRIRSAERRCHRGDAIEGLGRPDVLLPGGSVSILEAAGKLGRLLDATARYYVRGGTMVALETDPDGDVTLKVVKPAALASLFESVAKLKKLKVIEGQIVDVDATCTEQNAKLIQHAEPFIKALPAIYLLAPCPVLIERDGRLLQISGYDRPSGILAKGEPVPEVSLDTARPLLEGIVSDFRFATAGDRARALAALITPALVFGDLLRARAPLDLGEADQSQTGKGFRNRLTAAVFGSSVKTVTQKHGGVGSMEESFNTALIHGRAFVALDNIRGRIDSPALESFLTEDTYLARVPYQGSVEIDPRRVVVQMTSNKADLTRDLANRASCIRILKQEPGYLFREYREGDVLDHLRANQPLYLGAVFAVVRAWHRAGKPRSRETRHDFRGWAQTLDWIVQHLLGAGPLLDGHREAQLRMATPVLNWLRDVATAVRGAGRLDMLLRASDLVEIVAEDPSVEVPGLAEADDLSAEDVRKKVLQAMGRKLALCFKAGDQMTLDDLVIERVTEHDETLRREVRLYRFSPAPMEAGRIGAAIGADPASIGADTGAGHAATGAEGPAAPMEADFCAYGAPMAAPNKKAVAPNAPEGPVQGEHFGPTAPSVEEY